MKMTLLALVIVAVMPAPNVTAQVFKCATPKGIEYQDRPCADGKQAAVAVNQNTLTGMNESSQRAVSKDRAERLQAQAAREREESSKEAIARKYGEPVKYNVTETGKGKHEQCIYPGYDKRIVYFENGRATSTQYESPK